MKLTSIQLFSTNVGASPTVFSFRDPRKEYSYVIKDIIGLDPEEIIPRFSGASILTAAKYYSLGLSGRELVFSIALNPSFSINQSYSSLRDDLYKQISSSRQGQIKLWFVDGQNVVAELYGFVTKFESLLFEKSPEVKITITCDEPLLKSVYPFAVDVSSFGSLITVQDNVSTAPHGFEFSITFTGSASYFIIQDPNIQDWALHVDYTFQSGDKLYFSSKRENRFLYIIRQGVLIHLVDKLVPNSIWPIVFPGINNFRILGASFTWYYMNYNISYLGI